MGLLSQERGGFVRRKCDQFRWIERNKRISAPVERAGLDAKQRRQIAGNGAFVIEPLLRQLEPLWAARSILSSHAQLDGRTKSFEVSSPKLSNSGISLQASPIARQKTKKTHNRATNRIGG
jgi:hypothetical protein